MISQKLKQRKIQLLLTRISLSLLLRSKEILSIIVVLLFIGNYQICEYFYKDDLNKWWDLKTNIYSVIFGLCFKIALIGRRGFLKFILLIGFGFSVSDIIDRIFFDVTNFTNADILMIILTILTSYYTVYVRTRRIRRSTTTK